MEQTVQCSHVRRDVRLTRIGVRCGHCARSEAAAVISASWCWSGLIELAQVAARPAAPEPTTAIFILKTEGRGGLALGRGTHASIYGNRAGNLIGGRTPSGEVDKLGSARWFVSGLFICRHSSHRTVIMTSAVATLCQRARREWQSRLINTLRPQISR